MKINVSCLVAEQKKWGKKKRKISQGGPLFIFPVMPLGEFEY